MKLFQSGCTKRALAWSTLLAALLSLAPASDTAAQQPRSQLPISLVVSIGHRNSINGVTFSANGKVAATREHTGVVKLWDSQSARMIKTLKPHSYGSIISLSPDGTRAAGEGENGVVVIWNLSTGNVDKVLKDAAGRTDSLISFSADGNQLLIADGKVRIWDINTEKLVRTFSAPKSDGTSAVFIEGGRQIVSSGEDNISLWDTDSGKLVRRAPLSFPSGFYRVALSPNGALLAVIPYDKKKTVLLIDATTGKTSQTLIGPTENMRALAFSADGKQLAVGEESNVRLWDTATGKQVRSFKAGRDVIGTIAFSHTGQMITGDDANDVRFWSFGSGQPVLSEMTVHAGDTVSIAPSPDGKSFLSGSSGRTYIGQAGIPAADPKDSKTVRLWDISSGRLMQTFAGQAASQEPSEPVAFSPDGTRVLTAGKNTLKVWDTQNGALLRSLPSGHDASIATIDYSANGRNFVTSASYDKNLKIWSVETGKVLRTLKDTENTVATAVSPDSKRVAVGGAGKWVKLWDLDTGRPQRTLTGHTSFVTAIAFSPDGATLASASGDETLKIWDPNSGRTIRTIRGHTGEVNSVAFDASGQRLVSAAKDSTVRVWDAAGQLVRTYEGHLGAVNDARFTSDGRRIISAGSDGTIKIWNTGGSELLLTIAAFSNGDWVSMTPEGFFDASSPKAAESLTLVQGLEWYTVDQFYQSLYRPDLVREKLAGDPRGLVREAAARLDLNRVIASGNAPVVSIASPSDGDRLTSAQTNVGVDITATSGGIGRVEWRVNGVTVGVVIPPTAPAAGQPLRLTRQLALDEGTNQIEVVAYNQANFVASIPARVNVTAPAPATTGVQPRLFVMAVGLNNYADPQFRLQFAVPDAEALANGLRKAATGLFSNVDVTLVRDADATSANLDKVFTALSKKVQPTDTVVFFVAGHGKTVNGRYYFIPHAFKIDGDRTKLEVVEAAVVKQGVAQEQWQTWFANISARRSILLFDTCESGSLIDSDQVTKSIERGAASDRLAQATGRTIMTASASNQDAQEGFRGHGLFTYNFLEAIDKGDSDGNGKVDLSELATYVYARVTSLSERIYRRRQVPQVKIASSNYPLANRTALLPADASDTPLPSAPTHTISAASELLIQPALGAARVRQLDARTPVTVISSEAGWTLVAREGRMLGYVAARDLAPLR